jgi:hypothetical protein
MTEFDNPQLASWESFYVIVGSSGAALVGLQFVVMALIADLRSRAAPETISAFGTPTVFHFGAALVLSAIMSAPWVSLAPLAIVLALSGLGGLAYCALIIRRARRQTLYTPVQEDWVWHAILPSLFYAGVGLAAWLLGTRPRLALFVVAGAALGLLLVGIHNAWDTVTYMVTGADRAPAKEAPEGTAATTPSSEGAR